jgi:hypothetical protein
VWIGILLFEESDMDTNQWKWADLSKEQVVLLQEAEKTLGPGVKVLLAFKPGDSGKIGASAFQQNKLSVSPINESQVECLKGLEKQMQAVVIAYTQ